jgi:hypothetical protein
MSGVAELEFARIWRPIPKLVFSRTLNSVAGNARLATDDIATEVADSVTSRVMMASLPSAGRASPRPPSPRT